MKNNWKVKYEKLLQEHNILKKEYEELTKVKVENSKDYEVIRRLDIIGNMLGRYIRDKELKESKEKLNDAKKEWEFLTYDYNSRELRYENDYYYELKSSQTEEWR